MTEENSGAEPQIDTSAEVNTAAPEAAFLSPEAGAADQQQERDWDAEARDMGWVPEADFKGDKRPSKFLSAQEFVERGETVLPFVQRENKRLKEELAKQSKEFDERFTKLTKASESTLKAVQAQHAKELEDLKVRREKAVEAGDVSAFRQIDRQIADHEANTPEAPAEEALPQPEAREQAQKVEAAWVDQHKDWYEKDGVMTGYANWYSQGLAMKNPQITMEENLRQTEEAVKKQFPMYFSKGKADANGHAPVESGGDPKPTGSKTPLFDKLPKEAQAMAKADVAAGVYKTVEEWARIYNS